MPQLGETVTEGKITKWFKTAGDTVAPGDNLFEIETDKTSMEVPATFGGVLSAVNVQVGDVAKVGAVVAVILGEGRGRQSLKRRQRRKRRPHPQAAKPAAAAAPPVALRRCRAAKPAAPLDPFREVRTPERNFGPARLAGGITVTPLARRLAGENRHRSVAHQRFRPAWPHRRARRRIRASPRGAGIGAGAPDPPHADIKALYRDVPYEEVPLDGMRKTIAARLTEAKQTIPHFYLTADIGMDALLKVREEANAAAPKKDGKPAYKLSVNDFVIKALALALQRVPAANAIWARGPHPALPARRHRRRGRARRRPDHAGDPRRGRKIADRDLERDEGRSPTRARDKKLKPEEYQGGVSAISNLGMYGVREFSAIINPPQSTILAVGAAAAPSGRDAGWRHALRQAR